MAQKNININDTYLCTMVIFSIEIMFDLNLKTAEDMFTNLGLSINHQQKVCKEQEPYLHLPFSWNYAPL